MPSEPTQLHPRKPASASANASDVTLENCADEQIRLPGSIQQHGFMVGLDEPGERIVLASENAEEFLGTPMKLILGSSIELLVERELLSSIRNQRCAVEPEGMVTYLGSFRLRGELFAVITHCIESKRILEFERQDRLVGAEMMNSIITNFVGTLSKLETQEELCDAVTKQVAQLTGFDRVLLYSFDEEGHGTVLSEANNGVLPSYLDLRFPATDIPQQARELYVLNTVRIIPDAYYKPSPLRSIKAEAPHILDLSLSVLRSVSPIHVQYMRNMGTASSMSISIVSEGRLWGLISGHHSEPRMVPYLVRSACDMLSKLVGTQLTTFRTASRLSTLMRFHNTQRQLLTHIAGESNYLAALATHIDALSQVTSSDSVALWVDGKYESFGCVPPASDIEAIVQWLDTNRGMELYRTQRLGDDIAMPSGFEDCSSGLLAIRISDVRQRYVLWFRPQIIRTVKWAGEPVKPADPQEQLHPRKSFETWQETLRGQSVRWTEEEQESAREFRAAIVSISLRRAEEEAELSNARFEQLTHALPAKVFTASDDGSLIYTNERWRGEDGSGSGLWYGEGRLLPEDEERVAARWRQAVETGEDFEEEIRFLVGEERVPRWNLVRAVPFHRQGAARAGWVGSVIDLTDRREREAALRMTEKLALTGRMTSVIAHEINNPLESITNLLYLVRQDLPEEADATQYINQAESELERISGITKQTLRWGRENSGRVEQFRAGAVFADVLRLFRGKLQNRHVTATIVGGEDIAIEAIMGQIRQVVANLVSNAIDASQIGGKIWMEARTTADNQTEIVVGDQGAGMTAEVQAQLFQPFYSTKGDLGNGLGLYISHEIVERHGGTLRVETELGRGTVIHILLPANSSIGTSEQPDITNLPIA